MNTVTTYASTAVEFAATHVQSAVNAAATAVGKVPYAGPYASVAVHPVAAATAGYGLQALATKIMALAESYLKGADKEMSFMKANNAQKAIRVATIGAVVGAAYLAVGPTLLFGAVLAGQALHARCNMAAANSKPAPVGQ